MLSRLGLAGAHFTNRDEMRRPAPQRDAISSQMGAHSECKPERTPAMKKHNTERREQKKGEGRKTIGLDLGDRTSRYCVVDERGEAILEGSVATTESALRSWVEKMGPCVVAMEVGTHSPWVSRLLKECSQQVIVANARRVRLIIESSRKNDRLDART